MGFLNYFNVNIAIDTRNFLLPLILTILIIYVRGSIRYENNSSRITIFNYFNIVKEDLLIGPNLLINGIAIYTSELIRVSSNTNSSNGNFTNSILLLLLLFFLIYLHNDLFKKSAYKENPETELKWVAIVISNIFAIIFFTFTVHYH